MDHVSRFMNRGPETRAAFAGRSIWHNIDQSAFILQGPGPLRIAQIGSVDALTGARQPKVISPDQRRYERVLRRTNYIGPVREVL